jgi:hypothetical protein
MFVSELLIWIAGKCDYVHKIPVFTAVVAGLMEKIPRGVLKSNCRETESGKGHECKGRVCGPHSQ